MEFDINTAPDWALDLYHNLKDVLTIPEAAKFLRVGERSLRRYIDQGAIRAIKLGPHRNSPVRIARLDLLRFLVSREE